MQFIVLDLEWNISGKRQNGENAEEKHILHEEIIEIGAVRMNSAMEAADRFSVDVKPRYHLRMNSFVGRLTQRDSESLKEGLPFPEAAKAFYDWCGLEDDENIIFCTWSNSDAEPWLKNLEHYGLLPKDLPLFLDVQRVFSLAEGEQPAVQRSVQYALEYFDLPLDEPFHSAVNDAYYTAQILMRTIQKLQAEGKLPEDEGKLRRKLRTWAFDPGLNYKAQLELMRLRDPKELDDYLDELEFKCPACGRTLKLKGPWKMKKKPYKRRAEAFCEEHGDVRIRLTTFYNMRAAKQGRPAWTVRANLSVRRGL